MKIRSIWGGIAAAAVLLAPQTARAQDVFGSFGTRQAAIERTEKTPGGAAAARFRRFHVGLGASIWDSIAGVPGTLPGLPGGVGVSIEPQPGALLTADYDINRWLSAGAWFNPQTSDIQAHLPGGVFPGVPRDFNIGAVHSNQWDVHLRASLDSMKWLPKAVAEGLSLQAGYACTSNDVDFRYKVAGGKLIFGIPQPPPGKPLHVPGFGFTQKSANIWLNKSIRVGSFKVEDRRVPVTVFGSGGYYFDNFGQTKTLGTTGGSAWQALGGFSLGLSDTLTLGASYWLFDVGGADASRISTGLTWSF